MGLVSMIVGLLISLKNYRLLTILLVLVVIGILLGVLNH